MLSLPFNSSTLVVGWNKEENKKAGLDPDKPPTTWPETFEAAKKLRAAGVPCGFTWPGLQRACADREFQRLVHDLLATEANGLVALDARCLNSTTQP